MSTIDPPLQEVVYRALKSEYAAGNFTPGRRLDVQEIAERYRSSRTPVREALCRLMGEGLIEQHPDGGLRLVEYGAERLIQLYTWNMGLLLALVRDVRPSALKKAIEEATRQAVEVTPRGISHAVGTVFLSLARATGNEFAVSTVNNLNHRLHYVRIGEVSDVTSAARELSTLTNLSITDLQKAMRRRIEAYHLRRIDRNRPGSF